MRTLAVINQKGGVGKTTTAVHVADGLTRAGRRVLLVDLDPQSHASLHFDVQLDGGEPDLYHVLTGRAAVAEALRYVARSLVLLPSSIDLVGAELELRERDDRERILAQALAPYDEVFDDCLIDCPPSLGLLTVNALAAANGVIVPLQPHFLGLQGLGRLLETVTLARQALNPALRVAGIVLCLYEKGTRLAQEVSDDIQRFLASAAPEDAWHGAVLFETRIRRNIKLAECPSFGQTIFDYAPDSNGAADYEALTREVLALPPLEVRQHASAPREEVAARLAALEQMMSVSSGGAEAPSPRKRAHARQSADGPEDAA